MSTIDFVHCNRCLARPKNGVPIKIFFTSCYHLFCEKCITDNGTPCPVCKKNKQAVELKRDCDPKILMFFQDPQKMLATNMQTLMRKYNFQMGMVKSLLNAYKKQRERLGQLQQIAQKATSTTREKEEEINELKKWIETAEPKLKAMEAEREDLQRELAELRKVENRINTSNTFDGFMFEKEPNKASFAVSKNFVNPLDNFQVDENMDESGESDSDSMQVIPMSMNTMNSPVPSNSSLLSEITTPKLMGIASRGAEDTYSYRKKTPARAYNPYAELMNQSRAASNHLRTPLHRSPFSNGPGLSKIQSFTPHISRSNGTSQRPFSPNSIMRLGSAGFTPNMIRQTGNIIPKSNTPSFARPF